MPVLSDTGLIAPAPGLMVWTLITFLLVLWVLKRFAFTRIAELLEARRRSVQENLEAAEKARDDAHQLLEEYREQLAAARAEASQIVERARKAGEDERARMQEDLQAERERGVAAAQSAIQAETRQSLDKIRAEIAALTLQATEAVLAKKLDDAESRRLIEEALAGVDFSKLAGDARVDG
jgi:F-type H+-transporting ATPase subunit b